MARKKLLDPASLTIPFEEYQGLVGVNYSTLKHLRRSPLHYQHATQAPPEDKQSLLEGRAAHTAILEPDDFPVRYAVWTGGARRGAEWEQFKDAHVGRTILKEAEYREALAIRDAVHAHPVANRWLSKGKAEQSITWIDSRTKVVCKARIDFIGDAIVDVKRTANLDPHRFERTAFDLGYHLQGAFYRRGVCSLMGIEQRDAVPVRIIAVEGSAPHDVAPLVVDPGALEIADEELDRLLALLVTLRRKRDHTRWPGRYESESTLFLPRFAYELPEDAAGDLGLNIGGAA